MPEIRRNAITFLKQICAIKSTADFWEGFQNWCKKYEICCEDPYFSLRTGLVGFSTFYIITHHNGIGTTTIVYRITNAEMSTHTYTSSCLSWYLLKNWDKKAKFETSTAKDITNTPGFEKYLGYVITLIPPTEDEFTLKEPKFDPEYVMNKMAQLKRAIKRIRNNCPHKLIDIGTLKKCELCDCIF